MPIELVDIRLQEFKAVEKMFLKGNKVLELGAANGYQASLISNKGCDVIAIDVAIPEVDEKMFFPVRIYDGVHPPFANGSFDRIFSSNVLEHAKDITTLLAGLEKVLQKQGIIISILPTPSWRLWTSLGHYLFLVKYLAFRGQVKTFARKQASISSIAKAKGPFHFIKRVFVAGPHGEYKNALVELWAFSSKRWERVFLNAGLEVVQCFPSGLFYSGYRLMPFLSIDSRKKLARIMGSSSRIYVCRKRKEKLG
jgi:SAM-dependent methyltransferase